VDESILTYLTDVTCGTMSALCFSTVSAKIETYWRRQQSDASIGALHSPLSSDGKRKFEVLFILLDG
jgi:hypothetical protein